MPPSIAHIAWALLLVAAVAGCASTTDAPRSISGEDLAADPEPWVGEDLWVEGAPAGDVGCTAAGCEAPCNNCWMAIRAAAASWSWTRRRVGCPSPAGP